MEKSGGQDCLSLPKQLKAPYLKCCRHTFLVLPEPSWLCQQVGNFFFLSMNIVSKRRHSQGVQGSELDSHAQDTRSRSLPTLIPDWYSNNSSIARRDCRTPKAAASWQLRWQHWSCLAQCRAPSKSQSPKPQAVQHHRTPPLGNAPHLITSGMSTPFRPLLVLTLHNP